MDDYLTSRKPSSTRSPSLKPGAGRPNPNSSLNLATKDLLNKKDNSLGGGLERVNRAIVRTLGKEDNPVTNSTAYSRTLHVASCATGHQSGGGPSGSKWTLHRNTKLRIQSKAEESQALKGVVAYISSYTGSGITNTELKEVVERMGGVVKTMPGGRITHTFVLDHLSGSKTQKILDANKKSKVSKLVLPEWALECARRGRRVDEARFMAPVLDEVQESAYTIFSNLASDRRSASPSDATSSSSVSPPLATTSRSDPLAVNPSVSTSKGKGKEEKQSATALLLSHIYKRRANATPSPPRPKRGKKRVSAGGDEEGWEMGRRESPRKRSKEKGKEAKKEKGEEIIVLGSTEVDIEEEKEEEGREEPVRRVLNDAWAGLAEPTDGGGESEDDGLDEWGMPPSGQGC